MTQVLEIEQASASGIVALGAEALIVAAPAVVIPGEGARVLIEGWIEVDIPGAGAGLIRPRIRRGRLVTDTLISGTPDYNQGATSRAEHGIMAAETRTALSRVVYGLFCESSVAANATAWQIKVTTLPLLGKIAA